MPYQFSVKFLIHRLQPIFRRTHYPVGHGLPGQLHTLPVPFLLLSVQWTAQSKSYMWLYRTGSNAKHPIVLYEYSPNRKSKNAEVFLEGF